MEVLKVFHDPASHRPPVIETLSLTETCHLSHPTLSTFLDQPADVIRDKLLPDS